MEGKLLNIGYGNYVQLGRIVAIISPESAPIKRMIKDTRGSIDLIDATFGRKTRSVIVLDSKQLVLSALQPDTITSKITKKDKE